MLARVLALVTFILSGLLMVQAIVFRGSPSGDIPAQVPLVFSASLVALAITELIKAEPK